MTQEVKKVRYFRKKTLVAYTLEKVKKWGIRRTWNNDCPFLISTHIERLQVYQPPCNCLFSKCSCFCKKQAILNHWGYHCDHLQCIVFVVTLYWTSFIMPVLIPSFTQLLNKKAHRVWIRHWLSPSCITATLKRAYSFFMLFWSSFLSHSSMTAGGQKAALSHSDPHPVTEGLHGHYWNVFQVEEVNYSSLSWVTVFCGVKQAYMPPGTVKFHHLSASSASTWVFSLRSFCTYKIDRTDKIGTKAKLCFLSYHFRPREITGGFFPVCRLGNILNRMTESSTVCMKEKYGCEKKKIKWKSI